MTLLALILLSISLSMDSLIIGTSYSIRKIKLPFCSKMIVCFISILITSTAVTVGNSLSTVIPSYMSRFIGSFMLLLLGVYIIGPPIKDITQSKKEKYRNKDSKLPSSTVKIIKDPIYCDLDKSKHIDTFESIYLGIALSIDSFAAGISISINKNFCLFIVPLIVALGQFLFLSLGEIIGKKVSFRSKSDFRSLSILSGLMLIGISILRIFT